MSTAEDAAFAALAAKIAGDGRLPIEAYKDKCLRRRIGVRMRACGVQTYAEYHTVLDRNPAELERLRDAITINVTRFYRNPETWHLLRETVLREICAAGRPEIRAWSAGCSSGEEPYTLAMVIADCLESQGMGQRLSIVTIDGTDIDRECLAQAQTARYPVDTLAEVPDGFIQRYFEREGDVCRVAERVRRRVNLRASDMVNDPPPRRNYDLILCRNVVIYFGRATQERVFSVFAEALAPGGFLVLGKVETLFGPAREQLTLLDPRERVYRRAA
jgi:chemotaxis methyl-accepting protein methylase